MENNGKIGMHFNNGQYVEVDGDFWVKNGLDKFDIVRATKQGSLILFYGENLSEDEKAALGANEKKEEKTSFDVVMTSFGSAKLEIVRTVKEVMGLGLKESMNFVMGLPSAVKEGCSKEEAEMLKERFEEKGATIEIK